jgi:hypothetical protein
MELTVEATATALEVAHALEQALTAGPEQFRPTLGGLYAEQVELRHQPPLPPDGVVDGGRLAETSDKEALAITSALRDQHYADVEVGVDGDRVSIRASLVGTLADGSSVSLPTRMHCRIDHGGRVVAITHDMGVEAMRAWAEVAVAGGLVGAERLLHDGARE